MIDQIAKKRYEELARTAKNLEIKERAELCFLWSELKRQGQRFANEKEIGGYLAEVKKSRDGRKEYIRLLDEKPSIRKFFEKLTWNVRDFFSFQNNKTDTIPKAQENTGGVSAGKAGDAEVGHLEVGNVEADTDLEKLKVITDLEGNIKYTADQIEILTKRLEVFKAQIAAKESRAEISLLESSIKGKRSRIAEIEEEKKLVGQAGISSTTGDQFLSNFRTKAASEKAHEAQESRMIELEEKRSQLTKELKQQEIQLVKASATKDTDPDASIEELRRRALNVSNSVEKYQETNRRNNRLLSELKKEMTAEQQRKYEARSSRAQSLPPKPAADEHKEHPH